MRQRFDEHADQPNLSFELQHTLDERGMQQWLDDWRASDEYDAELDHNQNGEILAERIHTYVIPFSRRNCAIVWRELRDENRLIRIPVPEQEPAPNPMKSVWPADSRPKSDTGATVLDAKAVEAKAVRDADRAARVVERQSEPIPSVSVEVARKMVPLPQGEDKRHQTLKQVKKDRQLDITELRDAANAERIAIARAKGVYPPRG